MGHSLQNLSKQKELKRIAGLVFEKDSFNEQVFLKTLPISNV